MTTQQPDDSSRLFAEYAAHLKREHGVESKPLAQADLSNIEILGLSVQDIARQKAWFESSAGGKSVAVFWKEAFDAGVKQAVLAMKREIIADGWQPIETAPMDGSKIWATYYNQGSIIPVWTHPAYWHSQKKDWRAVGSNGSTLLIPTHWMPLPKPPTNQIEGDNP
jgi:hypothetical protein